MKKGHLQPNEQNLLAYIQPDLSADPSQLMLALEPFSVRGLATAGQVATLKNMDPKRVSEHLNTLSQSSFDRPAALRSVSVRLEGQRGRPEKLYLLTEEGATVMHTLFDCPDLRAPKLTETVEIVAAYAIMETYVRARTAGYTAHVEQPLYFANGKNNVRADVVVEAGSQLVIIEIEQVTNQGTLPRAVDKLARMHNYFNSQPRTKVSNQVRMLFNLPEKDTQTVLVWQQALRDVMDESGGPLSFELYGQRINAFLEHPDWEGLSGFERIEPAAARLTTPTPSAKPAEQSKGLDIHSANQVDELRAVMRARERVYGEQLRQVQNQIDHALRVQAFFEIMMLIHGASHYRGSPVNKYAAIPTESLEMMRRYLHDQQNARMLNDLKHMLEWIHDHNTGIMSLRNGFTAMVWDGFLFHHGFGRGGPLMINVRFPDFADQRSDIYVDVIIDRDMLGVPRQPGYVGLRDKKPEETALAWVLESMILYPHMIGLGEKPWMAQRGKAYGKKS